MSAGFVLKKDKRRAKLRRMRAWVLFFALSATSLYADDSTAKVDLLAGEKFADQYFRPPPTTEKGVSVLMEVMGSAPEMRTGSPCFKAGAWYQLYVQSTATLNNITSITDQDSIFKITLEQLWHIASTEVKNAGITPDQLASLTSDPDAVKLKTDPDPDTWKAAQDATKPSDSDSSKIDQPPTASAPSQQSVLVWGTVLEITSDGILVECRADPALVAGANNIPASDMQRDPNTVYGICFLKNYAGADQLTDNSTIKTNAVPSGPYSYQATDGSTKTIPSYTASQ